MTWTRRNPTNKRGARRCCPHCASRLVDRRKPGALRPAWLCPACGPIKRGTYASGLEADVGMYLQGLQRAGMISELREQVCVDVAPPNCKRINWRIDFEFMEAGRLVRLEAKGLEDAEYRIKAKLYRAKFSEELRIMRRGQRGGLVVEETNMIEDETA